MVETVTAGNTGTLRAGGTAGRGWCFRNREAYKRILRHWDPDLWEEQLLSWCWYPWGEFIILVVWTENGIDSRYQGGKPREESTSRISDGSRQTGRRKSFISLPLCSVPLVSPAHGIQQRNCWPKGNSLRGPTPVSLSKPGVEG